MNKNIYVGTGLEAIGYNDELISPLDLCVAVDEERSTHNNYLLIPMYFFDSKDNDGIANYFARSIQPQINEYAGTYNSKELRTAFPEEIIAGHRLYKTAEEIKNRLVTSQMQDRLPTTIPEPFIKENIASFIKAFAQSSYFKEACIKFNRTEDEYFKLRECGTRFYMHEMQMAFEAWKISKFDFIHIGVDLGQSPSDESIPHENARKAAWDDLKTYLKSLSELHVNPHKFCKHFTITLMGFGNSRCNACNAIVDSNRKLVAMGE